MAHAGIRPDPYCPGAIIIPRVMTIEIARKARVYQMQRLWDAGFLDPHLLAIYEPPGSWMPDADGWVDLIVIGIWQTGDNWLVRYHPETERVRLRTQVACRGEAATEEEADLSGIRLGYPYDR